MRVRAILVICAVASLGLWGIVAQGKQAGAQTRGHAPPPPVGKAGYWGHDQLVNVWKDLEARQVSNDRVLDGGTYSINIRIVKPDAHPMVHAHSCDTWVVQGGTAISVTGGKLLNQQKRPNVDDVIGSSIEGGVERPLKAGDILYVPPGVPHGFKDMKGFRAFLIRWNVK